MKRFPPFAVRMSPFLGLFALVIVVGGASSEAPRARDDMATIEEHLRGSLAERGRLEIRILANALRMIAEGRQTFGSDTLGGEAFWGGQLQLHRAIAGERLGGVGSGLSPRAALALGLKVDSDALPANLARALRAGQVDPGRSRRDRRTASPERCRRLDGVLRG